MISEIRKLFVYGTFLQGEPRNYYLNNCKLIQALEIPGRLYSTGRGYPAALFDGNSKETIAGEIYNLSGDSNKKLKELDEVECTRFDLYRRKDLKHKGHHFYLYEAGDRLKGYLNKENTINPGIWSRKGSVALKDPVEFAINFEKEQEEYSGAVSVNLHSLTGAHALYTHWASKIDPNFYDDAPFKKKLAKVVTKFRIKLVLDLHGTRGQKAEDIYPGIGNNREFLIGNNSYLHKLNDSAKSNGLVLGGLNVFPASIQMTVTKFVATKLGIPTMQVEINERLRDPEGNPSQFEKLVRFLTDYVYSIKTYI